MTPGVDGPWRVAESCIICVANSETVPAPLHELATRLGEAGVPVIEVITEPSCRLSDLLAAPGGADVLVLDVGLLIDPKAVMELRRVASSDPMIAGVSPRVAGSADAELWRWILPPVAYVPLGDPRCLYLKGSVLALFPLKQNVTFADWDAYALEINGGGFRMALANHAFCHPGPGGTAAPNLVARSKRLERSFPGTRAAVAAFLSGAPILADRLCTKLAPDDSGRRTVAFDLTHIGAKHSGTAEAALALITRAVEAWAKDWSVAVVAPASTYAFHFASAQNAPRRIDPADSATCAAVIRFGQPFSWKEVDAAVRRAPVLVVFLLDTIGLDCIRMAPDELDALWRFTLSEADGLLFNSAFTARQFERRFGFRAGQPRCASLHSLDTRDYGGGGTAAASDGSILVMGNGFSHKRVAETARLLARSFPGRRIAALGLAEKAVEGVAGSPSGALDDETLAALYGRAALVIYPSVYEGFGLPLLEALAHRKPVLARALEPFAEIAGGLPEAANLHFFHTDDELLGLIRSDPRWTETPAAGSPRNWNDALADLRRILDEAVEDADYARIIRRIDFLRGRLAWIRQKPFMDDPSFGDDLDRLAALAGRVARNAVHGLASLPGGRALIRLATRAGRRAP